MFKVLLKLRKAWKSVLIVMILLVVQAMGELALPDYTSRIVNVGIQQGGVESCAPEAIREEELQNILLATDEDNFILDKYTLLSKDDLSESDYNKYVKEYPALEKENIYILKKISKEDKEKLEDVMAKPLVMMYVIQDETKSESMRQYVISVLPVEVQSAFQNASLIDIIKAMPEEQSKQMIDNFGKQIEDTVGGMLSQSAITAVRTEYTAIGMDTDKIQSSYIWKAGFQMLGVAFLIMITGVTVMYFSSGMACKLAKYLREEVF